MTGTGLLKADQVRPAAIAIQDHRDVVRQPFGPNPGAQSPRVERVDRSCQDRAETPAQP